MTDDLDKFKAEVERADYCNMGQWGDAGVCIQGQVLDLIEENERLRVYHEDDEPSWRHRAEKLEKDVERLQEENRKLMGLHIAHLPLDESKITQTVTVSVCPECERLTKRCEEARHVIAVLLHAWKTDNRPPAMTVMSAGVWLEGKC